MSNPILAFIRYSFFCALLFSTSGMAMGQSSEDELDNSPTVAQVSSKHLIPPTVTLDDYEKLSIAGAKDGWEILSGNLAAWLERPANKRKLTSIDGKWLGDLPLFQVTLNPKVRGDELYCRYSLPIADTDTSMGPIVFFLFRKVTLEEIEAVRMLKPESVASYIDRSSKWQEMLKEEKKLSRTHSLRM